MVRHEKRVTSNILLALLLEGENRGEGGAPIMSSPFPLPRTGEGNTYTRIDSGLSCREIPARRL